MNHFKLASKISQIDWTTAELDEIKLMIASLPSLEAQIQFYKYCEAHKLGPLTYAQLKKYNLLSLFEEEVQELFRSIHQKINEQNEKRNESARELLQAFVREKIDVIVLKGNYLAHAVYQEIGYKRMNDFDILIHKENWDKIQDIYMGLGYIPLGFGWSGEKETPAKFSHVGMSFISRDLSCIVGSQWGLKSPTANFSVDISKAWQSKIPFDFIGIPVHALSCEFNLLHLILHMGIYKCGIRDCMDIYNLVRSKEVNHEKLKEILIQSGASEKAFFTLSLSDLCSVSFDTEFISSLQTKNSGYTQRRLKARLLTQSEAGDFQLSYIDHFQDIEKEVIYFNLFPKFHVKLKYYARFFRLVFFPKTSVCLKLNDKFHKPNILNKIVSRIKTPYFSFSLVAQEIGWKFTILLFFKLFVDLFISLKNYFVKKESYFSYLRKRGVDPTEIEKVVSNIQ